MAHYSKHFTMSTHPVSFILLLVAFTVGCGQSNPLGRQAISGRVTLDGTALNQGTIAFSPESRGGVSSGGIIRNGEYRILADRGLPPGKYRVRINSSAANPNQKNPPVKASPPGGTNESLGIERIAPTYNRASKIVIEVVAGQSSELNFDAKSKD